MTAPEISSSINENNVEKRAPDGKPSVVNQTISASRVVEEPNADTPALPWQVQCAIRFRNNGGCEENVYGTPAVDAKIPWGCFRSSAEEIAQQLCTKSPLTPPQSGVSDPCTKCMEMFKTAGGCAVWGTPMVHELIPEVCIECEDAENKCKKHCNVM